MGKKQKRRIARMTQRLANNRNIIKKEILNDADFRGYLKILAGIDYRHQIRQLQEQVDQLRLDPIAAPIIVDFNAFRREIATLPTNRRARGECVDIPITVLNSSESKNVPFTAQRVAVNAGRRTEYFNGWRIPAGVILTDFQTREA